MKKFLRILIMLAFIICLCGSLSADEKYIVLDVEGEGRDRNSAIESAWLTGIRQAVGSYIDAKTELSNDQLTERIIAYSRGLVDRYEVTGVDDSRASEGIYKVKMRLWIIQELLRDGAKHASTGSASITFSAEDVIRQQKEELDAKALESRNAAEETAKMKAKTGAELLSAMLERYKPEDFLTCYIPGKPEAIKDKADFFKLNVEINFNEKLYKESFIPDLIQVLDQIASVKKNTMLVKYKNEFRTLASKKSLNEATDSIVFKTDGLGKDNYTIAVYNKPERFGVRMYGFRSEDAGNISNVLAKFVSRAGRVQGIVLELQDEDKETIETIEQRIEMKYLMTKNEKNLWAVHPTIMQKSSRRGYIDYYKETVQIIHPVELEMPQEVLPYIKNIKVSLLLAEPIAPKKAWLGINFDAYNNARIKSFAPGSPAKSAGLREYSSIVSINGREVKSVSDVNKIIENFRPGDKITVKDNNGENHTVTLGEEPQK